jgi:hypothetical protein
MTAPIHPRITRWTIDHVLLDTGGSPRQGFWGWFRPKWKLFAAAAASALLTWQEWVIHHPPEIAIIAVLHFVFVLVAIAVVVHLIRWLIRANESAASGETKGSGTE